MVAYSFQPRFTEPIRAGTKRQTLRAVGKRRHARVGEQLQLYTGMRSKACKLIGKAYCLEIRGIVLNFARPHIGVFDTIEESPGRYERIERRLFDGRSLDHFAEDDGFANFDDMAIFWRDVHGVSRWEGLLIGWTGFAEELLSHADLEQKGRG